GLSSLVASRSTRAFLAYGNGSRIRHVVLGENIRQTLTARFPELTRHVFSMRHPYLFPTSALSAWPSDGCVRFGFLGVASRDKGFDAFCRLAARVSNECGADAAARFELVGRLSAEYRDALPEGASHVAIACEGKPLPRDLYDQR